MSDAVQDVGRSLATVLIATLLSVMLVWNESTAQVGNNSAGSLSVPIAVSDFVGTFTIKRFALVENQVVAVGTVVGTRAGNPAIGTQQVAVPVTRIVQGGASSVQGVVAQQATCDFLTLVLGPLHLDLLGLVVDLNQVVLEITGETGAGNLLGNLLCAIAGLLDPTGVLENLARNILTQIVNLLNQILAAL